jgi:hypothetical protein
MDQVEELDLVAYVPKELAKPALQDMTTPLPAGIRRVAGKELTQIDLANHWTAYPDFYPIGWRAINLRRNDAVGFVAFRTSL